MAHEVNDERRLEFVEQYLIDKSPEQFSQSVHQLKNQKEAVEGSSYGKKKN